MIAAWMLYALLVGALLAAAAWLMEDAVRLRGGAVRFLWLGALLATVGLVALAPVRSAAPALLPAAVAARPETPGGMRRVSELRQPSAAERVLAASRAALEGTLRRAAGLGAGTAGTALAAGWGVLSAALLALAAATVLRARRARRGWPAAEVAGTPVRVAPRVGPAVLGIRRPEVVIPAWLLHATEEEQRMVVMHEAEHVRARDPLVLAAGCLAVALMPWNPAAWWMLRRLRTAVEMDCDARVLRRGVGRRAYGTVLIEMAGRGPGLTLGAPALAGSPSTLERRIRAMNARLPRFARLRAGALGVLALAALAGACESPLPSSAEIEEMDVAAAEARAGSLAMTHPGGEVKYIVDGREVTREEAHALTSDRIVRMEMTRAAGNGTNIVRISTTPESVDDAQAEVRRAETRAAGNGDRVEVSILAPTGRTARVVPAGGFEGLVVIDNVVRDGSALRTIAPDGIEQVEVIKGEAATRLYDDPRAAHGVIRITTKAGAPTNP
jgi:hypothetical protein